MSLNIFCLSGLFQFADPFLLGLLSGASGKELACQCRRLKRCGFHPWIWKIPLEKEMATQSSVFARRIPWAEEPGGLQSIELQRVGHD